MAEHRGHAFTIDRQRGAERSLSIPGLCMRTITVPSLGICEEVWGTLVVASESARHLIDAHLREHGDAPVERKPMTEQERAELYRETFGRF
jgi:hypothetical protein